VIPGEMHTPRGKLKIRPAIPGDLQVFRPLRLRALHDHPEAFSADYQTHLDGGDEYWKRYLEYDENARLYLAFDGDTAVAMTSVCLGTSAKTRHIAEILGVYVLPEWRGVGIADALINACCEWAKSSGAVIARLGVTTVDESAIRCYERCGFVITGREPKTILVNGIYYDGYHMFRELT